ncbi:MAG: type I-E CRISPR-associated endoribonuclease Cas2 [Rhodobacteraceae bacterium]|nr:type I-E CRISPR-associated endoribonuclease Cas2 [Paracoccaceae bacterium]
MTMVVTRDVENRYRGFLTSVMLEIAPGVYVAPNFSKGIRRRVWNVISSWYSVLGRGAIVMVWRDGTQPGNLAIKTLGEQPKQIVNAGNILLVKRN